MSWLNNSLNTIKGQVSTLVQEVLAETVGPDSEYCDPAVDNRTALELLADTQKEKEELDKLCTEKEAEILTLRKQIVTLQQQQIGDTGGGAINAATSNLNSGRNSKTVSKTIPAF
uniref:Uncharacterized protein n=1 Tax=Glossina brevipalpis TaxID=37001 RepID=A0A1A9X5B5_9MUSC